MRKLVPMVLVVSVAASLIVVSMPVAGATKWIDASGNWSWVAPSEFFSVTKVADGNVFISAVEEDVFVGTLQGTGYGNFTLIVHPDEFVTGNGRTLFTGTVMDKSGTLEIQWVGNTNNDLHYWEFTWTILDGTGNLAALRGNGSAFGPGPAGLDVLGGADYDGTVHFAPT